MTLLNRRIAGAGARRGFTLIELMIVVAIIGILASIAIPRFLKYSYKSRIVERDTIMPHIRSHMLSALSERGTCTGVRDDYKCQANTWNPPYDGLVQGSANLQGPREWQISDATWTWVGKPAARLSMRYGIRVPDDWWTWPGSAGGAGSGTIWAFFDLDRNGGTRCDVWRRSSVAGEKEAAVLRLKDWVREERVNVFTSAL